MSLPGNGNADQNRSKTPSEAMAERLTSQLSKSSPHGIYVKLPELGPLMVAHQLTLIQFELFVCIQPRELINTRWMKAEKWDLAPTVLFYISHHNRISFWIVHEIVSRKESVDRVRFLRFIIDVAIECIGLGNFDTAFSIYGGLSTAPIYRLKLTWHDLGDNHKKKWKELREFGATVGNHHSYRTHLSKRLEANLPAIPFLGVFLSDLVRVHSIRPSNLPIQYIPSTIGSDSFSESRSRSSSLSLASLSAYSRSNTLTSSAPQKDLVFVQKYIGTLSL